ncbi:hypothetical protein ACLK1V_09715 [Escherichia coli]
MVHASKELNVYNALLMLFSVLITLAAASRARCFSTGLAQRGQRLFAVEIALYVYGGFSRQV